MTVTAIILAHYKERILNLDRIVSDLQNGSVAPDTICVFIDNPEIEYQNDKVIVIKSNKSFLPRVRFSLGTYFDSDYCLFIDDDLSVRNKTLENFIYYAKAIRVPYTIYGLQGSILGHTNNPYADDTSIKRGERKIPVEVDVILRTYFVSRESMHSGFLMQTLNPSLPDISLDDMYMSLGNKVFNNGKNYVIGIDEESDVSEISEHGVGQSYSGIHYENRNMVAKILMDKYDL